MSYFYFLKTKNYKGLKSFNVVALVILLIAVGFFTFNFKIATADPATEVLSSSPIAADVSMTMNENTSATITLSPDTDVLTQTLTYYSIVESPAHGSLSAIYGNQITYTPTAYYYGADSFTYKANNGSADSNIATVSFTINHTNQPPSPTRTNIDKNIFNNNKLTNLSSLGFLIKNGIFYIKNLAVTETARIQGLEMVDKTTRDIYCTWIDNGEWQKAKGECGSISASTPEAISFSTSTPQISADKIKQEIKEELKQELEQELKLQAKSQATSQVPSEVQQPEQPQPQEQLQQQLPEQLSQLEENQPQVQPEQPAQSEQSPLPDQLPQLEENQLQEVQPEQPVQPEQSLTPAPESQQPEANLLKSFGDFIKWIFKSTWEGTVSTTKTIGQSTVNLIDSMGVYLEAGSQNISSGVNSATANLSDSMKGLWEMVKWIFHK